MSLVDKTSPLAVKMDGAAVVRTWTIITLVRHGKKVGQSVHSDYGCGRVAQHSFIALAVGSTNF